MLNLILGGAGLPDLRQKLAEKMGVIIAPEVPWRLKPTHLAPESQR
jgi:hypothetical protein